MEVGCQSPWITRFFQDLGHEVLVANPRKLRAIFQNDRKCDLYDARMLAKLTRFDPQDASPYQASVGASTARFIADQVKGKFGPEAS